MQKYKLYYSKVESKKLTTNVNNAEYLDVRWRYGSNICITCSYHERLHLYQMGVVEYEVYCTPFSILLNAAIQKRTLLNFSPFKLKSILCSLQK